MKKFLIVMMVMIFVAPFITGCEQRSEDEYAEYVSVDVYSYTRYFVDVYIGNAFVERLAPGEDGYYTKDLYDDEKLRLNFIVWKPSGPVEIKTEFDNDLDDYHVNIYDDSVESY